jgi:putative SOS response-associated peptidase YedK
MPVIIQPESYDLWLSPGVPSSDALRELMVPYASDDLEVMAVSTMVNNPRIEGPQCFSRPETLFD